MKTENYKDCAKSDMMNDALKHYEEAGRAINHWRSDIYEAIKAYYSESNQLESESPRPVEDGNDCECVNSELLVEYSGGYCRCKWCGKKMTHMDVSEGNPSSSRPQENDKSDMDIVAKFPEQKTIKAKLVYEQPEHDVSEDDLRTAIENALYATHRFLTTDCSDLADGILLYMKDAGYFASLREVKMPDRDDYIRYVSKNYEGVHVYYMIIAFDYVISELKRINNLK